MALIEVKQLKYRYPHTDKLALDGIDFTVEKGQFIGIIGENKAGKSTLCQAFVGLVPSMFRGAYGGTLMIHGMEAAKTPVAKLCRHVGLVFQNPFNQLSGAKETVFEEVAFGLQNLGIPREEIIRRVEDNLSRLDILDYKNRNPFDLSGGQTQRVAIASILAMEPKVIVLDEPTSQLDPQGSEEVFQVVEALKQSGITILMVEHKMEKLAEYCDKILLLHQGRQIAYDTPERIFSRADLEQYGVEPPVYTKVCKKLEIYRESGDQKEYPVTLSQTVEKKDSFPKTLSGREIEKQGALWEEEVSKEQEVLFEIQDLEFGYTSQKLVIHSLSLKLSKQPTAIIGQNGAGKTTLVRLLKGLLKPGDGQILLNGEDISEKTVAKLAGVVGYVFQNPDDQIFKNKVIDEVMVGPLHIGMSREEAGKRAREALSMVDMTKWEQENPYDLDLSERKMVAIASVIAMEPKVLILDEPTIAQDIKGRKLLGSIIKKLSDKGVFVLAILHDMDFVAEYFDRVIVMAHGKVLADGPKEAVFYDKDSLSTARLEQPHMTRLCEALGYQGIFLTADDIKDKGRD